MKVYSLMGSFDYEGSELLGVFGNMEDLMKHYKSLKRSFDSYGYVESELGQGVSWVDVVPLVK